MTTYNSGNPIGSTDSRDRLDNTENMDYLENSTTELTHADRLGTVRKTRHGMEVEHDAQIAAHETEHDAQIAAHESEHDAQMQAFESDFDGRLAGMAFTRVGSFTTGATLTDMRQVLVWEASQGGDGHEYGWAGTFPKVVAPGATPATSGGIGAGAWVDRTDLMLRSDINIIQRRFNSVSNMVSDVSLSVGQIVETLGYYNDWVATSDKPKGGNKYGIVAAGTGTHDGGSFITLDNGLQAKGLFVSGEVNVCQFGAKGDGVTDDTTAIQHAINASERVHIPSGRYLNNGINVFSNCSINGDKTKAYDYSSGTTLICSDTAISGITIQGTGINISDITILNESLNKPIYAIGKLDNSTSLFNYNISNVTVNGLLTKAFSFPYAWNGTFTNCRAEGGLHDIGFYFDTGTSTTLTSCLSYGHTQTGFDFKFLYYSTLNSCGCDGGKVGFLFRQGNRLVANSLGTEALSSYSIHITEGGNVLAFNSPTLIATGASTNVIKIDTYHENPSTSNIVFNSFSMPQDFYPLSGGRVFDIVNPRPNVQLNNYYLYNEDIETDIYSVNKINKREVRAVSATGSFFKVGCSENVAVGSIFGGYDFVHNSPSYPDSVNPLARIAAARAIADSVGELQFLIRNGGTLNKVLTLNRYGHLIPSGTDKKLGDETVSFANGFISKIRPGNGTVIWTSGTGSPEGVITAPPGSLYTNTSGGAGTTLYIKESGFAATGWVAK